MTEVLWVKLKKEILGYSKVASYEPETEEIRIYGVVGNPYPFLIIVIVSLIFIVILIRLLRRKNKK